MNEEDIPDADQSGQEMEDYLAASTPAPRTVTRDPRSAPSTTMRTSTTRDHHETTAPGRPLTDPSRADPDIPNG